ncbi:hypothetical protein IWW38_004742, partial [Coemansia aciculifera]
MRECRVAPTPATAVSAMQILRRRSRTAAVMARFRQAAASCQLVSAHEFTQAASVVLDDPGAWRGGAALLVRCLELGHVPHSAAVDALAVRLPGLSAKAAESRPLLQALRADPAQAADRLASELSSLTDDQEIGSGLAVGDQRKSYAETVHAVVRLLLRSGSLRQAEQLAAAAGRAQIGGDRREREPDVVAALVVGLVAAGRLGEAATAAARLDRLVADRPSARAFGALVQFASASGDVSAVEAAWRQMSAAGIDGDGGAHRSRITCFAASGDLLRTQRAYADMLYAGHAPRASAVAALVRCAVRAGAVGLALAAVRDAEMSGCRVASASYNYILSRCVSISSQHARFGALLEAMLSTPDTRLVRSVSAPLTVHHLPPPGRTRSLAAWLEEADHRVVARRLVSWLTSRAAYPGVDAGVRKVGDEEEEKGKEEDTRSPHPHPSPSPPPPPTATTFIIALRFYGQNRRWADVLRVWDALAAFNRRISQLQEENPPAERHRVVPFSRMIGWVALALVETGRLGEARALWEAAANDGTLSANACDCGMDYMLQKL